MLSLLISLCLPLFAQAAPVDLLALKPTQTEGSVTRENGTTQFSAGFLAVAAIYHKISYTGKSYDMKASFARTRGSDGIGFVIPVGTQKVALILGGWDSRYDGLKLVNGLDPSDNKNPTRRASKVMNGDDVDLLVSVRPGKISVQVNGKPHFDLDTTANKLTVLKDIQEKFQDGVGLYIVNGDLDVVSWSIEEKK